MIKQKRKIILASRSPARKKLLKKARLCISVAYADINEARRKDEPVGRYAIRVAFAKAVKIAHQYKDAVVIGADTVIAIDSRILGKPKNEKQAVLFLRTLSGRWHKVYTGVAVIDAKNNRTIKKLVVSSVKFLKLSSDQIGRYIKTGEPLRAAGAYSIQQKGGRLIETVDGCFSNVVGISVPAIIKILKSLKAI